MTSADYRGWLSSLLQGLDAFGPDAQAAAAYIRQRGTRVSVHDQPTGARWTAGGRIEISPHYAQLAPNSPMAVSLIIHEVRHLQQGALTALSVYGELDAWQLQFNFLKSVTGRYQADPEREVVIGQLMQLALDWDRSTLEAARGLMRTYAGKTYRVDLLPLYPLRAELLYRIFGTKPVARNAARP